VTSPATCPDERDAQGDLTAPDGRAAADERSSGHRLGLY
jgi:hypothetical protein